MLSDSAPRESGVEEVKDGPRAATAVIKGEASLPSSSRPSLLPPAELRLITTVHRCVQ